MGVQNNDIILKDLVVYFPVRQGIVKAVDHVSATFQFGKITGIIGESGCGKSVMGMAVLGLLPQYAKAEGQILYQGKDLRMLSPSDMRKMRGTNLGLIPQNPADSLNPVRKIGSQILEAALLTGEKKQKSRENMDKMLIQFGFDKNIVHRVEKAYAFELSGGMQQRVAAVMGVASKPQWILADEPSKGLDLQLRKQMYKTLQQIKTECTDSMLIITHDLILAKTLCDCVMVMYAGQIIEIGERTLDQPKHPYTQALLQSLPENGFQPMKGKAPSPGENFEGCRFAPRCSYAKEECRKSVPGYYQTENGMVRCFRYAGSKKSK
ncbi:MAG: ABC transporter ATP-binding protein [Eubacteriales bacterium]|nr:ABC transporter ATP-binding protein [Eubacteriales bacterium]